MARGIEIRGALKLWRSGKSIDDVCLWLEAKTGKPWTREKFVKETRKRVGVPAKLTGTDRKKTAWKCTRCGAATVDYYVWRRVAGGKAQKWRGDVTCVSCMRGLDMRLPVT